MNRFLDNKTSKISEIPHLNSENKVIHFASQYMWLDWHKLLPKNNKYIVSFFHGKPEDSDEVAKHIHDFVETKNEIFKVITASSLVYKD